MRGLAVIILIHLTCLVCGQEFTAGQKIEPGLVRGNIEITDYNRDGRLDIFEMGQSTDGSRVNRLLRNTGIDFQPFSTIVQGGMDSSADWGDFDSDGDLDLVTIGFQNTVVAQVYENIDGTVLALKSTLVGVSRGSAEWADFDNDGDLDILICGQGADNLHHTFIYENENGVFTRNFENQLINVGFGQASWFDYDSDGDPDILVSGLTDIDGARDTRLYENNITSFTDSGINNFISLGYSSMDFGDLDNDGDLDVVMIGLTAAFEARVYIYQNNGTGFARIFEDALTHISEGQVEILDVNNDGLLDIFLQGRLDGQNAYLVQVYTNNGNGFDPYFSVDIANQSGSAWGDLDNDGDLDVVLNGFNDAEEFTSQIYWNQNTNSTLAENANSLPAAPENLSVNVEIGKVTFSWDEAVDTETLQAALTYNLYLEDENNQIVISPLSHNDGRRKVMKVGNAGSSNTFILNRNLGQGDYVWGVQTIDASFGGSTFKRSAFSITQGVGTGTNFLTYSLAEQSGEANIDFQQHTIEIEVTEGTDLTSLIPSFMLSSGASSQVESVTQTSGVTANDFTAPLLYTIEAEDGVTTQDWVVTVKHESEPVPAGPVSISNTKVFKGALGGSRIGRLSVNGGSSTFSLPAGLGDNNDFEVSGNELLAAFRLDADSYTVYVKSTESVSSISALSIETVPVSLATVLTNGILLENYRLFGVPSSDMRVEELFPDLNPSEQGTSWKIVSYDEGVMSSLTTSSVFEPGKGYWYLNEDEPGDNNLRFSYVPLTSNREFELELKSGWNIISNPFLGTLDWATVIGFNESEGIISSGDVTSSGVFTYNGSYNMSSILSVFGGGWVMSSNDVTIKLPDPTFNSGGRITSHSAEHSWIQDNDNWQLIVNLSSDGQSSNLAGIGMRSEASDGVDRFDLQSPPPVSEGMSFELRDEEGLVRSFKSPADTKEWNFEVDVFQHSVVSVSWDSEVLKELQEDVYLFVSDWNKTYNMQSVSKLEIPSGTSLKIIYGDDFDKSTLQFPVEVYPNPAHEDVLFDFYLSGPDSHYEVSLEIFDSSGRLILKNNVTKQSNKKEQIRLNRNSLPAGVFLFKLSYEEAQSKVQKLIVR